jgi:hypothetical protein
MLQVKRQNPSFERFINNSWHERAGENPKCFQARQRVPNLDTNGCRDGLPTESGGAGMGGFLTAMRSTIHSPDVENDFVCPDVEMTVHQA